jgi:translation initiation factor SUI1
MDFQFEDFKTESLSKNMVTISVQKRNGRQCITNIIGLENDLDLKKITKYLKKKHNCNGAILNDKQFGEIITLSGDQKEQVYNFLIEEEINKKDEIIVKNMF